MAYGARPVPQNIMSVEFKIFEFMNVKQFMFSFGLILLCGVLWFFMPSPWNILVPLLLIISGGIIIFVPFNGDPFMVFISSFLEAMISPQRRVWYRKGLLVKTAYRAARRYQFGNDPEEEANDFKFLENQQIQITPEQKELDKEEEQFLKKEAQAANANQASQQKVIVPANVSQKSVQAYVNLNNYAQGQQDNHQTAQPIQSAPQQNSQGQNAQMPTQNQTQQAAPQQNQPAANMQDTVAELKDMMAPKSSDEADDEVAVKNFIFGNVEDANGKPVTNAAVVIKQGPKNLEVVITGQGGDFITKFEYKEGQYLLHVNVGAEEFNEVVVKHDPIDPLPILIHPKDYVDASAQTGPVEPVYDVPNEEGIFEGAYDSHVFDLGVDYDEQVPEQAQPKPEQQSIPQAPQAVETPDVQSPVPQVEMRQPQPTQPEDQISFEDQMLGKIDSLHMPTEEQHEVAPEPPQPAPVMQQVQSVAQAPIIQTPADNTLSLKDFAQKNTQQTQEGGFRFVNDGKSPAEQTINQGTIVPDQTQPQQVQQLAQQAETVLIDFKSQPYSAATFNQGFSNMPNTVNGEIIDQGGNYLSGVFVDIKDMQGNTLRILQTASDGKFYTQSSMPYGQYLIGIRKDGYRFNDFVVNMDGGTIPPKVIQAL